MIADFSFAHTKESSPLVRATIVFFKWMLGFGLNSLHEFLKLYKNLQRGRMSLDPLMVRAFELESYCRPLRTPHNYTMLIARRYREAQARQNQPCVCKRYQNGKSDSAS